MSGAAIKDSNPYNGKLPDTLLEQKQKILQILERSVAQVEFSAYVIA